MDLSNENIIHVKKGDVEYLHFKELLKFLHFCAVNHGKGLI